MKQAYIISRGAEEFAAAREQFALIVDRLQSAAVLGMEHDEVEGLISREGTELMRRLLAGAPRCACGGGDARGGCAGGPMGWYEAMYEKGVEGVWGRSLGRSR
jgi:hypothetical protein